MANKRPDGDGLVRKRSDGCWEGRIVVGHKVDGKPIYYELFLLELGTGLRLGEILALQWDDLNMENGELRITKSATFIKGELHITEPKTKSSE